jgi:hypothetical protein
MMTLAGYLQALFLASRARLNWQIALCGLAAMD